ncbi:TIR domain-containing protein [Cryptosporangium sp. NPDC051539]|uniref:TIR domain-containing protein n=1 Tax=Cryptosporangium sp. NPDC051539 TaxID=3363962 RepID=UPI00379C2596
MTVFISHDFGDGPEFENVTHFLDSESVPYWEPGDISVGESLRDRLRDAIGQCSACIFVATHKSVHSSWCATELGAFWGAGRPVLVYLADSSLPETDLPPIVHGLLWERSLVKIAGRAHELDRGPESDPGTPVPDSARIGNLTVKQLESLVVGAVALANATHKDDPLAPDGTATKDAAVRLLRGIDLTSQLRIDESSDWRRTILWVDDVPQNNSYERAALEALGLTITTVTSTREALAQLADRRFGAVISDMGRREGPDEGYVLLDALRAHDKQTPFFVYSSSRSPEHRREANHRGAQGATNSPTELVDLLVDTLPSRIAG